MFMPYTVSALKTKAECDEMIEKLQKEKRDLEFQKTVIGHQKVNNAEDASLVSTEFSANVTEIATLESSIATLPEGKAKQYHVTRKKKLEWRQEVLKKRKGETGGIALLNKEFDLVCIDKELAEADVLIADVTAHKATL